MAVGGRPLFGRGSLTSGMGKTIAGDQVLRIGRGDASQDGIFLDRVHGVGRAFVNWPPFLPDTWA